MDQPAILAKGWGYWDVTHYPYGGCFRRAVEDTPVLIIGPGMKADDSEVCFPDGRKGYVRKQALTIQATN